MKAIVLAAGRGSRMLEGTANIPKCMMSVCGKPLILRCIESLHRAGFKNGEIYIITGYKGGIVRNTLQGINYLENEIWDKTNMVGTLTKADKILANEDCIILYSDIIFSEKAIERAIEDASDLVLPYYTEYLQLWKERFSDPLEDLETFTTDNKGYLIEIGSRPQSFNQVHGQYMGILKTTPAGWTILKNAIPLASKPIEKLDMTTLINTVVSHNNKVKCVPCSELWLECDNQHDIQIYEEKYNAMLKD